MSPDRYGLSAFIIRSLQNCHAVTTAPFTGMAQRQARGAHNSEVTRSKRVAGISNSPALQKLVVIAHATSKHETYIAGVAQRQSA